MIPGDHWHAQNLFCSLSLLFAVLLNFRAFFGGGVPGGYGLKAATGTAISAAARLAAEGAGAEQRHKHLAALWCSCPCSSLLLLSSSLPGSSPPSLGLLGLTEEKQGLLQRAILKLCNSHLRFHVCPSFSFLSDVLHATAKYQCCRQPTAASLGHAHYAVGPSWQAGWC